MKLIFLHPGKHQTFLEVDSINVGGLGQSCPKCPE